MNEKLKNIYEESGIFIVVRNINYYKRFQKMQNSLDEESF